MQLPCFVYSDNVEMVCIDNLGCFVVEYSFWEGSSRGVLVCLCENKTTLDEIFKIAIYTSLEPIQLLKADRPLLKHETQHFVCV